MSRYAREPLDLSALKTVPLASRGGKVRVADFAAPYRKGSGLSGWLATLPRILAANSFRSVVEALMAARSRGRAIIWGMGGHVIKCGLAPVLADLAERGFATAFAMNGSAAIHDFEIALAGRTSEDVEAVLPDGRFGSAEETGREMNLAIATGDREKLGIGEALGRALEQIADPRYAAGSLLLAAYRGSIPVTVHVAVGTDTPHTHPAADPSAIGSGSHRDFRLLCSLIRDLNNGGVYLNVGSAVVLPEVFLKAVSAVRNLGHPLADFTTVNFDFLQHYRPKVNVVERPHAQAGGAGFAITGHHETDAAASGCRADRVRAMNGRPDPYRVAPGRAAGAPSVSGATEISSSSSDWPCLRCLRVHSWFCSGGRAPPHRPQPSSWNFCPRNSRLRHPVWVPLPHLSLPLWASLLAVPGMGAAAGSASRFVLFGILLAFAVGLLGAVLQTPDINSPMKELLSSPRSVLLIAVFGTTLGPFFEELAFRGFMQPLFVRTLGVVPGILLAAAAFGAPSSAGVWRIPGATPSSSPAPEPRSAGPVTRPDPPWPPRLCTPPTTARFSLLWWRRGRNFRIHGKHD